jgi:hypothetical protein
MAAREGLKAVDMFEAIERGAIKALWVMATNPAVSLPRAGEFRAALNKLDLFVVSETTLRNDTVEAGARVLLPAAAWGEKDGTVTNSERRVSRQRAFLPLPGEAQPDWWIVSEVAQQLGFTQAFAYRTPADIFREHAALSAFENDGQRDFDLGGLAGLADADYDLLDSVMWPLPESAERGEKRVFADGGFFTSDRRGRFIAPAFPQLRAATSEAFPLRLNTGRLRDQWHTMTRTGQSPRLGAHCPEPQVDIHPDDAAMAGLQDGGFARVTTQHASTVLRVCIRPGQQRGSIFASDPLEQCYGLRCARRSVGDGGHGSVFGPAGAQGHAGAGRASRVCLSGVCVNARADRAPARHMVRACRRSRRSRPSVRHQRITHTLARACRTVDRRRHRARRIYRPAARHCATSPPFATAGSRPASSAGRRKIRRIGKSCARCSMRAFWRSAIGVFSCPAAARRAWRKAGRLPVPVSASGSKPSAAQ